MLVTMRAGLSFAAVLGLLVLCVWALKRGSIRLSKFAPRGTIVIETATSISTSLIPTHRINSFGTTALARSPT